MTFPIKQALLLPFMLSLAVTTHVFSAILPEDEEIAMIPGMGTESHAPDAPQLAETAPATTSASPTGQTGQPAQVATNPTSQPAANAQPMNNGEVPTPTTTQPPDALAPPDPPPTLAPPGINSSGQLIVTTNEQLEVAARAAAGRFDPFVQLVPPSIELPSPSPTPLAMDRLMGGFSGKLPSKVTPPPKRVIPRKGGLMVPRLPSTPNMSDGDITVTRGLELTGIMTIDKEVMALMSIDGNNRIVKVGQSLRDGVSIGAINLRLGTLTLLKGTQTAVLKVKE